MMSASYVVVVVNSVGVVKYCVSCSARSVVCLRVVGRRVAVVRLERLPLLPVLGVRTETVVRAVGTVSISVKTSVKSLPPGSGVRSGSGLVDGTLVVDLKKRGKSRGGETGDGESTWKMHYELFAIYSFSSDWDAWPGCLLVTGSRQTLY